MHNYIGLILGKDDSGDFEGRFLRKGNGEVYHSKPTFVSKDEDKCCFPREDILMKLPQQKNCWWRRSSRDAVHLSVDSREFGHPLTTEQRRAY